MPFPCDDHENGGLCECRDRDLDFLAKVLEIAYLKVKKVEEASGGHMGSLNIWRVAQCLRKLDDGGG